MHASQPLVWRRSWANTTPSSSISATMVRQFTTIDSLVCLSLSTGQSADVLLHRDDQRSVRLSSLKPDARWFVFRPRWAAGCGAGQEFHFETGNNRNIEKGKREARSPPSGSSITSPGGHSPTTGIRTGLWGTVRGIRFRPCVSGGRNGVTSRTLGRPGSSCPRQASAGRPQDPPRRRHPVGVAPLRTTASYDPGGD